MLSLSWRRLVPLQVCVLAACLIVCSLMKQKNANAAELDSVFVMLQVRKLPQVRPDKIAAVGCDSPNSVLICRS